MGFSFRQINDGLQHAMGLQAEVSGTQVSVCSVRESHVLSIDAAVVGVGQLYILM